MNAKVIEKADFKAAADCFLFCGVGGDTIKRALEDDLCEILNYKKGALIYNETQFKRSLGLVISGSVGVTKDMSGGRKYIMNTISSPGLFGAAAIFSGVEDYVTSINALNDCRIAFLPQKLIEALIDENSAVAKNYIAFLSDRIQFLNKKLQSLVTVSTSQSVSKFIVANMKIVDGIYALSVKSYSDLAQMLNMGRASLYRSLDDFERRGIILRDGKKIVITDPKGLIKISASGTAE